MDWKPSTYLNTEILPNQLEILRGKHRIIFWNDGKGTFTNSRGPNSEYSFTGMIPNKSSEEVQRMLVKFMESKMLCFNNWKRKNGY